MEIFGDSIVDLRYSSGIVSFVIHRGGAAARGAGINIPFDDFAEILNLLSREITSIAAAHQAWLVEPRGNPAPFDAAATQNQAPLALGPKIASV